MVFKKLNSAIVIMAILFVSSGCSTNNEPEDQIGMSKSANADVEDDRNRSQEDAAVKVLCEIPFELTDSNNIAVAATINNADDVKLMFHTANAGVVITREASQRATSVQFEKSAKMKSWGGDSDGQISENNSLKISTLNWDNLRIFQDRLSGTGTDGKFGPDLFDENVIEISYDLKAIKIRTGVPKASSEFEAFKLIQENELLFLMGKVRIGERFVENKFLIHSGFGGGVLLDDEFAKTNDVSNLKVLSESELRDSGGNVLKTKKIELPSLKIGEFEFKNIPAQVFEGAIRKQKMSIIGGDVLKRFNIIIDRRSNSLFLQKSKAFAIELAR